MSNQQPSESNQPVVPVWLGVTAAIGSMLFAGSVGKFYYGNVGVLGAFAVSLIIILGTILIQIDD